MTTAVIGYGYWGPKLVRNFLRHGPVVVCDTSANAQQRALKDFPGIEVMNDYDLLLQRADVEAVAIATPVATHYDLAHKALFHRKHVLVEKPLTNDVVTAYALVELAKELGLVLMVDHTFLYHPAVRHIKAMLDRYDMGKLDYIDSSRINLGLFQPDINVLWDLAVHDISIALHLIGERPIVVQAVGAKHGGSEHANIGTLFLRYQSGLFVHINVSWISPVKMRSMIIGGSKKMVVYDDLNVAEPVKVFDTGFTKSVTAFDYRTGDVLSPKIGNREALADMAADFVGSIAAKTSPISSGAFGLEVVRVLEAAQESLEKNGQEILL